MVGVCCDDLRNDDLRPAIAEVLNDPDLRKAIETTEFGRRLVEKTSEKMPDLGSGDLAGLAETFQEAAEGALTGWLEEHSGLWAVRPRVRYYAAAKLRRVRNVVFNITAQSERRMIWPRYKENFAALETMADVANEEGIPLLFYVFPIRNDVKVPYDDEEYAQFKKDLENLAKEKQCAFVNLESLVPPEFWGMKASTKLDKKAELDFMHFQFAGHKLLAGELERLAKERLMGRWNNLKITIEPLHYLDRAEHVLFLLLARVLVNLCQYVETPVEK